MSFKALAIGHLAFTMAMVGLMSAVQLVIYPAFRSVASADFATYVTRHGEAIVRPLILFAPLEVVLALLLWLRAPSGAEKTVAFISGALLAIAWVSTMVWYGPFHGRLANEAFDPAKIEMLISTNWFRTLLWWARGAIAVWLTWVSVL